MYICNVLMGLFSPMSNLTHTNKHHISQKRLGYAAVTNNPKNSVD